MNGKAVQKAEIVQMKKNCAWISSTGRSLVFLIITILKVNIKYSDLMEISSPFAHKRIQLSSCICAHTLIHKYKHEKWKSVKNFG